MFWRDKAKSQLQVFCQRSRKDTMGQKVLSLEHKCKVRHLNASHFISTKVRHLRWQISSSYLSRTTKVLYSSRFFLSFFFFRHQTSSALTKCPILTKLCQKYPLVHHYSGFKAQIVTCHTEVTKGQKVIFHLKRYYSMTKWPRIFKIGQNIPYNHAHVQNAGFKIQKSFGVTRGQNRSNGYFRLKCYLFYK